MKYQNVLKRIRNMALPDRLSARLAAYGFWRLKAL